LQIPRPSAAASTARPITLAPVAVEDGERFHARTEVLGHDLLQAGRIGVLAVRGLMPLVGGRDGGEHLGVDAA